MLMSCVYSVCLCGMLWLNVICVNNRVVMVIVCVLVVVMRWLVFVVWVVCVSCVLVSVLVVMFYGLLVDVCVCSVMVFV